MEDFVAISYSEYERFLKIEAFLEALEAAGVDNWSGYEDALEIFEEEEGEAYGE